MDKVLDFKFILLTSSIYEDDEKGKFTGAMMDWKQVNEIIDYERCNDIAKQNRRNKLNVIIN